MGNEKIRHFIARHRKGATAYYWQPAAKLFRCGWEIERLDPDRGKAIARAEELNTAVDAWRETGGLADQTRPEQNKIGGGPWKIKPAPAKDLVEHGTVAWLVRQYQQDRRFTGKAPKTQRHYRELCDIVIRFYGTEQATALNAGHVEAYYKRAFKVTPSLANHVVTMIRTLYNFRAWYEASHGRQRPRDEENPAYRPAIMAAPRKDPVLWPRAAALAFADQADQMGMGSIGTAVLIGYWLAQREGDIIALPPAAYANGRFRVRQSKTGAVVTPMLPPSLLVRVDAQLKRQAEAAAAAKIRRLAPPTTLLICEGTGDAWKEDWFRHAFAKIRAKLTDQTPFFATEDGGRVETAKLLFMHLRHTGVTQLGLAGEPPQGIAAISGHTLKGVIQILDRYNIRTTKAADQAMAKRIEMEGE